MENNYITCRLEGRTGNLMFEVANVLNQSIIHQREFVIPRFEKRLSHLESTLFRKIDKWIDDVDKIEESKEYHGLFEFHQVPNPHDNIPTIYSGYYQSEKFFEKVKDEVRDLFSPPSDFFEKVYKEYPFFKNEIVVGINIRRGDYLKVSNRHPVVSLDYIQGSFKYLPKHDKVLVMSDDIEWCKENIKLPNIVFSDNSKFWDEYGIWLLSLCHHFIISNSTFSWWGAWLSNYKDKVVITPSTWFGPKIEYSSDDICCDDWIKIPTEYKDGRIVPINSKDIKNKSII
jgi:hypothetical protein